MGEGRERKRGGGGGEWERVREEFSYASMQSMVLVLHSMALGLPP